MQSLAAGIKWIMLVSGVITATMLYAVVAPAAALTSIFGDALNGPVAEVVVRNWGALIGLVGAMLIHGAFVPAARRVALTVAALSKVTFIGLLLANGFGQQAVVPITVDTVFTVLFVAYLVGVRQPPTAA